MPNTLHRKTLVVVGCGAAAVLLLAELAQTNDHPLDIYLIDPNPAAPLGVAYSVNHPAFILNVAAKRMGAYVSKPDDFYQWLLAAPDKWRNLHADFSDSHFAPDDFVPRMIYAEYLQAIFSRAIASLQKNNSHVLQIKEQVIAVSPVAEQDDRLVWVSTPQQRFLADIVVFATGNNPAENINIRGVHNVSSPYSADFFQQDWAAVNNVAILGAGLSMVDAVQYISCQGFTGNFHIISRNALLPLPHCDEQPMAAAPLFDPDTVGSSALQVVRGLRTYVESNCVAGFEWQESINKIRPHTSDIWSRLSVKERQRLTRVLPWWNIHRHRIAPAPVANIQQLREQQRITITRARVTAVNNIHGGFQLRSADKVRDVKADRLIVCSGYASGFQRVKKLGEKLLIPDMDLCKTLVKNDATFKVSYTHNLFALGPALSGVLFESTALHETRQQANRIAAVVSSLINE